MVNQHQGTVHISSGVGCGTTVMIRFPLIS
ncbi:hypothetical protein [Paenibacillus sp. FSL H3-0286]